MQEGHMPVLVEEVMIDALSGSRQPADRCHARRRWAHRADPGGDRRLMAASSASTPMGRPSPESPVASSPASAIVSSSARRTSASCGPSPRMPASARSTASSSTSGCRASSWPTQSAASASGPAVRSTCASTRRAASPPRSCSRRSTPPSSRRSSGATARSRRRRGSPGRSSPSGRRPPVATAEELAALVERVAPGNPRVRRRIHPATRVFQALRIAVNEELDALQDGSRRRGRPPAARRPARRPQLPLARGPDRQAVHRRRAPGLHLPARAAGLRLRPEPPPAPRDPPVADPDGDRDRRQPPRPERPPAGRRAPGRLNTSIHRARREEDSS